jgi:cysteinyl-tRNA synthetase
VRNITDVDDKINARAAERKIDIRELTDETYKNFKNDVAALGCLPPTVEPRATEHIEEMKTLIERLVKAGHAYVAEDNVLFNVPSMPDYGKLSNRPLDEMIAGARVEVAPYKKDPQDFVLWKPSKAGEPGWPSPAGIKGPGRPGWHIECSAMSWKHLGETFDIHGGGIDLVFPHHENEIAQSRCAFDTRVMANYWMHNGFLQVEGEKMSKSLGNFITIHELLETAKFGNHPWEGGVLRLAMLKTHYRQPIDWTVARLSTSDAELSNWMDLIGNLPLSEVENRPSRNVVEALSDDLNTHEVFVQLSEIAKAAANSREARSELACNLIFLGILPDPYLQAKLFQSFTSKFDNWQKKQDELADRWGRKFSVISKYAGRVKVGEISRLQAVVDFSLVNELIEKRLNARAAKNWSESDRIRDELAAMGIVLKDSKDGTTWEVAR